MQRLQALCAKSEHCEYELREKMRRWEIPSEKADKIIEKLRENNIYVNISYPWPIHTMKGYQYLGWHEGDLPNTESAAKEIFSLPMYPSLENEEVKRVIEVLKGV